MIGAHSVAPYPTVYLKNLRYGVKLSTSWLKAAPLIITSWVELGTEGIGYLVAYLLLHLLADYRHVEQHTHAVVLNLREYLLADNLLDNQRNCNDNGWLDASECLSDDGWARDAGEIEEMAALDEFEDKLKRHAVHGCAIGRILMTESPGLIFLPSTSSAKSALPQSARYGTITPLEKPVVPLV